MSWSEIRPYVKATRWATNLLIVLLIFVSFRVARVSSWQAIFPAFVSFWIACTTMIQNDFRDRVHDLKKDKRHAFDHPRQYFHLLLVLWIVSVGLSLVMLACYGWSSCFLALLCVVIGLTYSELLMVPALPNLLVATASALTVLFPIAMYPEINALRVMELFLAVLGTIHGREIIKDIEDRRLDYGHKWTWLQWRGKKWTRRAATISFILGTLPLFPLLPTIGSQLVFITPLPGIAAVIFLNDRCEFRPEGLNMVKMACDVYTVILFLGLLVYGSS